MISWWQSRHPNTPCRDAGAEFKNGWGGLLGFPRYLGGREAGLVCSLSLLWIDGSKLNTI